MPQPTGHDVPLGSAEPPVPSGGPLISLPPNVAGGTPAIVRTARSAIGQAGVVRSLRVLRKANQFGGFDCPSCAWPEPDDHRSVTEFCENGAKAMASEATLARAGPAFFARCSVAEMAARDDKWLNDAGRLTHPMVLRPGATHYEPIEWADAFALLAEHLRRLPGPDAAAFYTSGRTSNEAAFLYQLFARQWGTNNLPDCSNMCHESSGYALTRSIGIGKGTVRLADFDLADSIWVIGQNPGTNHPRMLTTLQRAARRGCAIVSVNPLREAGLVAFKHPQEAWKVASGGTPIASLFVRVRIAGDLALLKGVMKEMLEEDDRSGGKTIRHDFIRDRTEGFEALAADLRAESWETIVDRSGVDRATIHAAAEVAMRSQRMIVCWAMGLTQHVAAVATIQTLANFALLRGHIGRPGAGLCPVRGHSNVQGDRTMGICEAMPDWFLDRLGAEFGFAPPRRRGLDAVNAIRAMHEGSVRVFVALGGNFLSATPDTRYTEEALRRCDLTAQVSTKLNRSHLVTGRTALILPCLGRTERDVQAGGEQIVSVEDSTGKVQASRGVLPPASGHLLSEPAIVCRLARAVLGESSAVPWDEFEASYDLARDRIARVIPGFEDYNRRVRERNGFYLPNGPREGVFPTEFGRARFFVHAIPPSSLEPGRLTLMTIRAHDQFNTTIYDHDDRYRGIRRGRRVIFLNARDIAASGLRPGQLVDITSHHAGRERNARRFTLVEYDIPPGCAAAYFPETNVLVPVESVAEGSNQPASKGVVVTLRPSAAAQETP